MTAKKRAGLRSGAVPLLAIAVLAVVLRLGLVAAWYTGDLHRFNASDYGLYMLGAVDFEAHHTFDNSLFLVRPPLFSLLIYALGRDDVRVLVTNALIGALLAPLSVILAGQLGLARRWTWLVGVVVAADATSIVFSACLASEPLTNVLLVAAVVALLHAVTRPQRSVGMAWGAAAGGLLGLAALTRPANYLLWIVLGAWLLIAFRRQWRAVGVFMLVAASISGAWIVHNGVVFHHYTMSTIGPFTMLYYRAAPIEHLATGDTMDAVYTRLNQRVEVHLGHDPTGIAANQRDTYLAASPELTAALNAVSVEVFKEHPLLYVATIPIGFARMFGLASATFGEWPLLGALEIAWNAVFLMASGAGLWFALRRRQWMLWWGVLLLCGYFTAGTLLVETAGMNARMHSMLVPFMAAAAVYAVQVFGEQRQAPPETPTPGPTVHS